MKKVHKSFRTYLRSYCLFRNASGLATRDSRNIRWLPYGKNTKLSKRKKLVSALVAFSDLENGLISKTYQPFLLQAAREGKTLLNLQIEMWADGVREGSFILQEFMVDKRLRALPNWVWVAIKQQAIEDPTVIPKCLFLRSLATGKSALYGLL